MLQEVKSALRFSNYGFVIWLLHPIWIETQSILLLFLLFDGLETQKRFLLSLVNPHLLIVADVQANVHATKRLTASHHVERHQDSTLAPSNGRA